MHDGRPGIDEWRHPRLGAAGEAAFLVHGEVAPALIAHRMHGGGEQQQDIHAVGIELFRHVNEVLRHALDPETVGIQHVERRLAQMRQRLDDAAAGLQQLRPFIRDDDVERLALADMKFDEIGNVVTLTTARRTPAACSLSRPWSISALPATSISGFGVVAVSGRIRLPSPAAMIMAVSGMRAGVVRVMGGSGFTACAGRGGSQRHTRP